MNGHPSNLGVMNYHQESKEDESTNKKVWQKYRIRSQQIRESCGSNLLNSGWEEEEGYGTNM